MLTQREKMVKSYEDNLKQNGVPFNITSKPYKSTIPFAASIVNKQATGGQFQGVCFAVFAPQQQEAFSYGVGGQRPTGIVGLAGQVTKTATDSDTNIAKQRSTNGAGDFVIEAVSCSQATIYSGVGVNQNGTIPNSDTQAGIPGSLITDPNVISAMLAANALVDPAGILTPPQVFSPLNLENCIFEALAPHLSVEYEWNRSRIEKIGTLDQVGEGGAKSLLRSHGMPDPQNRYRIQEGYVWRRDGQPDSDFIVRVKLNEPVVVVLNLPQYDDAGDTVFVDLKTIIVDLAVRLHGIELSIPSSN